MPYEVWSLRNQVNLYMVTFNKFLFLNVKLIIYGQEKNVMCKNCELPVIDGCLYYRGVHNREVSALYLCP